jgi:hypothetical protein
MTLMPAQRLETRVPGMNKKGRVRTGADADLPPSICANSRPLYLSTTVDLSEGIRFVLVNGVFVVRNGHLEQNFAEPHGRPIRAEVR